MWARLTKAAPILLGLFVLAVPPTAAVSNEWPKIAIGGYDPVAYFTNGRATHGNQEYVHVWHDAMYLFATPSHREAFIKDPARYAPQFDGFCVFGMTAGQKLEADPEAWAIVNGKLYVTFDKAMQAKLLADPQSVIASAEARWATLSH
ncbi:MAG: YHS domain-containing (seleno)protein [Alphaproteobacteria bacterium]